MVGNAVLRRVVGADLLGAVARADLRQALGAFSGLLFGQHLLVQACTKNGHSSDLVLQLAFLVLRLNHQTRRKVRDAHGGVGGVNALAARAAGAEHVDAQVVFLDVDFHLVGLGEHGNGCRGGVDAALAFRLGNTLHAVNAALELHDREHLVALNLELDFLVAAGLGRRNVHGFDLPALMVAEALVHLVQVAREDGSLVAAGSGADLHDDVLLVGRVGGNEHELDVLFKLRKLALDAGDLFLAELLHVGVAQKLLGFRQVVQVADVLARLGYQRALVGIAFRQLVVLALVGKHRRVAELLLKLFIGADDLLKLFAHVIPSQTSRARHMRANRTGRLPRKIHSIIS